MKTTILLVVAWLAAVSAHSSLRHHESSIELLEDFKGRMLKKETGDTEPTTKTQASGDTESRKESRDNDDTKESRDNDEDDDDEDTRESRDNDEDDDDDDEETRAHRKGFRRGVKDFCDFIHVVDEDFRCAEEVSDAIEEVFNVEVLMDDDCDDADDEDEVCLEISDSGDCDEVVDDALDEVEEFCVSDDDGDRYYDNDRSYYYHRHSDRRDGGRRSNRRKRDRRDGDTDDTGDTHGTGKSSDSQD